MKKLIRPAALFLYLLVIPISFLLGLVYVRITGSAEGQGLAGGAILLMTGLFFVLVGLSLSIYLVAKMATTTLKRVNKVLGIIVLMCVLFIGFRLKEKNKELVEPYELNRPKTKALIWLSNSNPTGALSFY